ncbi:MAG: hypothetical protein SVW77_00995 [Candidatus Nanohaloarchaea archaeon]|nr:hypothetical protein [Candidatus Nanohaloarchaea archaeon]
MALDISAAVEDGAHRTVERNGLLLVAAFLLLNLVSSLLGVGSGPGGAGGPPTAVNSPVALFIIGIAASLLSVVVSITAIRVFVTDETETVPDEAFQRNIGSAVLHTIIGGILFGIAVGIGLILLVIPWRCSSGWCSSRWRMSHSILPCSPRGSCPRGTGGSCSACLS